MRAYAAIMCIWWGAYFLGKKKRLGGSLRKQRNFHYSRRVLALFDRSVSSCKPFSSSAEQHCSLLGVCFFERENKFV